MECRKVSQCHNGVMDGHIWSHHRSQVTVCHMTRVTWGPWESKCIATVVKCISSRELSKNSIKFSLSNSEQRDSWLNFSHWTLDADIDLLNISANINCLKTWLALIKRSFWGLSIIFKTMRIVEELMEIWPNEVCDRSAK